MVTGDLFDRCHLPTTTPEELGFSVYWEVLSATGWATHRTVGVDGLDMSFPSVGALECTHLNVRNGANEVCDTKAAAESFRKKMTYQRD